MHVAQMSAFTVFVHMHNWDIHNIDILSKLYNIQWPGGNTSACYLSIYVLIMQTIDNTHM